MHRWFLCAALAVVSVLLGIMPAWALRVAQPPGPARVAEANGIVIGRVVGHEPKDIQLSPFPGVDNKVTYRVAAVNVSEVIKGEKNLKSIRVAFMPPADNPRPGIRPGLRGGPQLGVGDDGMLFLTKHHSEKDLYLVQNYYDVVPKTGNPGFDKEVKDAKRVMKLLENPMAGLKSESAQDRLDTAAILIAQYRSPRNAGGKTEAIPAEESKLILSAILNGNWNQGGRLGQQQGSWEIFLQLGLTDKDGWVFPQKVNNVSQLHAAAKTWLKKNADSYRIQRFVPGTTSNPPGAVRPGVQPGGIRIQPAVEPKRD